MFKGEGTSGDHHKAESTEARYWDGAARSSDEASVMEVERRGSVKPPERRSQLQRQEEGRCQAKPYDIDKWLVVEAYNRVKANAGSAGVDRQSLEDFDRDRRNNLYKLWNRMSSGSYMPPPVRAVSIPKKSGGERILGIPTVTDRIAQMVVKLQFEPEVEPHFLEDSYGYRPGKSAIQAIGVTRKRCWRHPWVLEFDIRGLFDNIPHELLLKAIDRHTANPWVKLYIRRWLTAPLVHADGRTDERDKGTPQGGVISPLLANLFLHYTFDRWISQHFPAIEWCRYADDGLLHCSTQRQARFLLHSLHERFRECGLELHTEKTKIVYCQDHRRASNHTHTSFDFLGYTFKKRVVKGRSGELFLGFCPGISRPSIQGIIEKVRKWRIGQRTDLSITDIAGFINPYLHGWWNYYGRYYRSLMYRVARYVNQRLVRWAMRKFKHLRGRKKKTIATLERLVKVRPKLFAHWSQGMSGAFA
ncbi:group II intron reverse transcriptase/maturase [Halomonas sp. LS-001]